MHKHIKNSTIAFYMKSGCQGNGTMETDRNGITLGERVETKVSGLLFG